MVNASDIVSYIFELVAEYGLLALIVVTALDTSLLLPVIPGELLLVAAVGQFATSRPMLIVTILAATLGATIGSLMLYGIARGGGRGFIERHPRLFLMSPERRDKLEKLFQRPLGQVLVAVFRLFPFLRIIVSLPAGLAKMPLPRFLILSTIGNLAFIGGLMWFVYESRQPGSAVARQLQEYQESYGDPAVALVRLHWLLVAAAIVSIGIFMVFVRAAKVQRRPDGSAPPLSLLSAIVTIGLFVGGVGLLVGMWFEPILVYAALARIGWHPEAQFADMPGGPGMIVGLVGALAVSLSLMLVVLQRGAAANKAKIAADNQRELEGLTDAFQWRKDRY